MKNKLGNWMPDGSGSHFIMTSRVSHVGINLTIMIWFLPAKRSSP